MATTEQIVANLVAKVTADGTRLTAEETARSTLTAQLNNYSVAQTAYASSLTTESENVKAVVRNHARDVNMLQQHASDMQAAL